MNKKILILFTVVFAISLIVFSYFLSPQKEIKQTINSPSITVKEDRTAQEEDAMKMSSKNKLASSESSEPPIKDNENKEEQISLSKSKVEELVAKTYSAESITSVTDAVMKIHANDSGPLTDWSLSTRENLIEVFNQPESIEKLSSLGLVNNFIECKSSTCEINLGMVDLTNNPVSPETSMEMAIILGSSGVAANSEMYTVIETDDNSFRIFLKDRSGN